MRKSHFSVTRTKAAAKLFIIVIFGLALSLPRSARAPTVQAYKTYGDKRWSDYDLPVVVNLEEITRSLGSISPDRVREEIGKAMDEWNSVGTPFRFVEGQGANAREEVRIVIAPQTRTRMPANASAGTCFVTEDTCGSSNLSCQGSPPDDAAQCVLIAINESQTFKTTCWPSAGPVDLQTVVLHELGHALGLDHSDDRGAVMWDDIGVWGQISCDRDLNDDDKKGLISLYGPPTDLPPADTPILVSPPDRAMIVTEQAQLDWQDSSNAMSYYVQISNSADFLNPIFNANPTRSFVGSIPGLGSGITYFWRVKAKGAGGNSIWSEIREFTIGRPALAPVLYGQSEFPILEPRQETEIYITLQNTGSQTWMAGHYALVNVNDQPLGAPSEMALDVDVPSGSPVTWRFSITAPVVPGIYRTEWWFSYDGVRMRPRVWMYIIVIPGGSPEEWIKDWWKEVVRQIIEMIRAAAWQAVEDFLNELCGGSVVTLILSLAVLWLGHRRSRVANRKN